MMDVADCCKDMSTYVYVRRTKVTYSRAVEDFDRDQVGVLGDSIRTTTNRTSNMSSMTSIVYVGSGYEGLAERGTTAELFVVDVDAGIDDVRISIASSTGVVEICVET